jgi:hypothetical protein
MYYFRKKSACTNETTNDYKILVVRCQKSKCLEDLILDGVLMMYRILSVRGNDDVKKYEIAENIDSVEGLLHVDAEDEYFTLFILYE